MNITYTSHLNQTYAAVEKPSTSLVMAHITADLGPTSSVVDDVARSLLCDLLLSGAGEMNREAFLDAVNGAGGSIAVRAHEGRITVTIETIESRLPKILTLMELMLLRPTFLETEIARAKENHKKQLKLAGEQARSMAQTNLICNLYREGDRYYQYTPAQELKVINAITKEQLQELHQRFLHLPWRITIGSNERAIAKIKKSLSKVQQNNEVAIASVFKPVSNASATKPRFVTEQISSQQNIEVSVGHRLPLSLDEAEYPAVMFALAVLGRWGGFSGRLMSTVREKEGLTYGIYARTEAAERDVFGHWRIMTFFHPKDLERGIESVLREINKLKRSGITTAELLRFKNILATSHTLLFDSLATLTSTVHAYNTKNLSFAEYEDIMERMQKLTVKDINTAIKNYLDPNKLSYSLAGNFTDLGSQLKSLRNSLKL